MAAIVRSRPSCAVSESCLELAAGDKLKPGPFESILRHGSGRGWSACSATSLLLPCERLSSFVAGFLVSVLVEIFLALRSLFWCFFNTFCVYKRVSALTLLMIVLNWVSVVIDLRCWVDEDRADCWIVRQVFLLSIIIFRMNFFISLIRFWYFRWFTKLERVKLRSMDCRGSSMFRVDRSGNNFGKYMFVRCLGKRFSALRVVRRLSWADVDANFSDNLCTRDEVWHTRVLPGNIVSTIAVVPPADNVLL